MNGGKAKLNLKGLKKSRKRPAKVWINPNSTFRGPDSNRSSDHRNQGPTRAARYLELGDQALGFNRISSLPDKKKAAA